jgi:hypothetical protein
MNSNKNIVISGQKLKLTPFERFFLNTSISNSSSNYGLLLKGETFETLELPSFKIFVQLF